MEIDKALLYEKSGETACDGEYPGKDGYLDISVTPRRLYLYQYQSPSLPYDAVEILTVHSSLYASDPPGVALGTSYNHNQDYDCSGDTTVSLRGP